MTLETEILADSPDRYYRLGETSGTVALDSSGNGSHATIGGSTTLGVPGLDNNSNNTAFGFVPGDYVQLNSAASFGLSFTFEMMFHADDLQNFADATAHNGAILTYYSSGPSISHGIFIYKDRLKIANSNWLAGEYCVFNEPLVNGRDYHLVLRGDRIGFDRYVTAWINGVQQGASINYTQGITIDRIGCTNNGPNSTVQRLHGVVDEVALYSVALSDARIAAHYAEIDLANGAQQIAANLEITVEAVTSIIFARIKQTVYESGAVSISLSQTVTENIGVVGFSLSQSVYETDVISLNLLQSVYDTTITPAPSWSLSISVGGVDFSPVLTGRVEISGEEQEAKLAQFTIKPALGTIDIYEWVNKRVLIDYTNNGTTRIYTGIVDRPVYDPNTGLTTFYCTDALQNTFNNLTNEQIDSLLNGYHSPHIFTADSRGWDYAKEQLSTLTKAYDLDANGAGRLTDWAAKATPDFTFTDSNILYNSLKVDLANRDKVHNTHNITFQYRFQRLRERLRSYVWVYPLHFTHWLVSPTTLPTRTMINDAVESAGWTIASENYVNPPPPAAIEVGIGKTIYWNIDESVRQELLFSALFSMKRRWVQTVTEEYDIKVFANQSVAKLGELKQSSQFSVSSSEETDGWEDFTVTPDGVQSVSVNDDIIIDVTSGEVSRADADLAVNTIQARAKAELLQSHRQNQCSFSVLLNPFLDRTHTVQITTAQVTAKGKVKSYRHVFDLEKGSALTDSVLAISKAQATGAPVDTPIQPPVEAPKVDPVAIDPPQVVLDTHIGGSQFSPGYDETWTGFLGNNALTAAQKFQNRSSNPETEPEREQAFTNIYPGSAVYPYVFRIPAPAIETLLTDSLEAQSAQIVEVAIPEDTLIMAA